MWLLFALGQSMSATFWGMATFLDTRCGKSRILSSFPHYRIFTRNSRIFRSISKKQIRWELTISLKKMNVLGQDTETPPVVTIDDYKLDAICQFTYLGSTMTDNLSFDEETRGLGRHLQISLVRSLECGQAPSCRRRQIWRAAMPVLPAHCSMTARHGLHMPGRREGSTHSTWEASAVSWEYPGKTT